MSSEIDALRQRAQQWIEDFEGAAVRPGETFLIIRDLLAALEAQQGRWQDISTAPTNWAHVLVGEPTGEVAEAYFNNELGEWVRANLGLDDPDSVIEPTHWQPLPAAPEAK
jgi:hypothetical protein